jgi:putative transposase
MNDKLKFRKHLRLRGYDYSSNGFYFITICCKQFKPLFGQVIDDGMVLNQFGHVADEQWLALPERYKQVCCHSHQIMPNHMHGILEIYNSSTSNQQIGQIIGSYKSLTYKHCREQSHESDLGKIWQPNYYEHVIRNQAAFEKISQYIETNPEQWDKDSYYIK